jgi:asparagine synthase (glutamine-hydrolysing)
MVTGPSSPAEASWFLVFPDTDAVAALAARARARGTREVPHPSGRPWLIGRWPDHAVTTTVRGSARLVVVGEHGVGEEEAARAIRAGSLEAADAYARSWPGSHHLVACFDGSTLVRGTITGVRSVFTARVPGPDGAHLVSDRADVLADLTGADLDEARLAVHLLSPGILHPLTTQTVWRGVDVVPGDRRVLLERDGRLRTSRWWSPPPAGLPLAEGARLVRERLADAVAVRIAGRGLVSADLGGVDSTAVVATAARAGAKTVAYTAAIHDVLGDDVTHARRTVEALEAVEHHVVPATAVPLTFDRVNELHDTLDTPSVYAVNRHRRMYIVERAAERGSALHLSGMGGDELFSGASAHVHGLLPRHPRTAWRLTRGFCSRHRWSRRTALAQLLDRRPYAAWLARVADELTQPQPSLSVPMFTWGTAPRLPPWATGRAVEAVRELIRRQAQETEPLDFGHGGHRELATLRSLARFARHVQQMSEPLGVTFTAPYYDDLLVEAALAVRPQDRVTPWRYKPLLEEAMRGIVPEAVRRRTTKAHAAYEEETGLRRHRAALLALWEDSRLAELGLVDVAALREWSLRPLAADLESALLHPTVGCEVWLRTRERDHGPMGPVATDSGGITA